MLQWHRWLGTWQNKVTRYIALNDFSRDKLVAAGLPIDRVVVKPNFVDLPAQVEGLRSGLLFVGRLAEEKGIRVLAQAAALLPPNVKITVIGAGPEAGVLAGDPKFELMGTLAPEQVYRQMMSASALLVPSIVQETFGMVAIEAFACGLPVIASRLGALAGVVSDRQTGLHFTAGDAHDLATKITYALNQPLETRRMGRAARVEYEAKYAPANNLQQLERIYCDAIEAARARHHTP
jgi:glycosyltransferase involved in cell wall biosynthesis